MNNNLNAQILWLKRQKAYEPNSGFLKRVLTEKVADKRPRIEERVMSPRSSSALNLEQGRRPVYENAESTLACSVEVDQSQNAKSKPHSTQRQGLSMSNPDPQIRSSAYSQSSERTVSMPATSYVESGSLSSNNLVNVSRKRISEIPLKPTRSESQPQPNLIQTQAKLIELLRQQSKLLMQKCSIIESTSLSEDAKRQRLASEVNPTLKRLQQELQAQEHLVDKYTQSQSVTTHTADKDYMAPLLSRAAAPTQKEDSNHQLANEPTSSWKSAPPDLVTVLDEEDEDEEDEEPVVISQKVIEKRSTHNLDGETNNQRKLRRQKNINYKIPSLEDSFNYKMGRGDSQIEENDTTMEAEPEDSNFLTTEDEIRDEVHSSDRDFVEDGLQNFLGDIEDAEYNSVDGDHSNTENGADCTPPPSSCVNISTPHIEVIGSSPLNSNRKADGQHSTHRTPELDLVEKEKYNDDFEYDSIIDSIQHTAISNNDVLRDPIVESLDLSVPQRSQAALEELDDIFTNSDLDDFEDFDAEREYQTQKADLKDLDDDLKIISEQKLDQASFPVLHVKKEVINVDSLFDEEQDSAFDDEDDFSLSEIRGSKRKSGKEVNSTEINSTNASLPTYLWTNEVNYRLRNVFRLPGFRPNQLDAINATLEGKDVFVLMPTGGGKSLCYQLPAIVRSGKTCGTTVVISPLISLMQDQVEHLLAKNIKACMFSSKGTAEQRRQVFNLFINGLLDLIYISPEMISASEQCKKAINKLYRDQKLARIVVDEAHCVSNWGHDFRPDYKELKYFKNEYPDIPVMALTATASEQVRMDIVHNLQLSNPVLLKQSFNRTNLFYQVVKKGKNAVFEISDAIKSRFHNQTGIIYCHSKNSCEQTASLLQRNGINCAYYHAGMESDERMQVQQAWQSDNIKVICATVAFGMGIDKPDVRFVYHLTVPRTLEGYYQETGRAGRDGNFSYCIMYYSFRDVRTIQTMIQKDTNLDRENKEKHLTKLQQVMQYCENTTDCRRQLVLSYFNEKFASELCQNNCDNCKESRNTITEERDMTTEALQIVNLVKSVQDEKVTLIHCQDIYKGSRNSKIVQLGHDRLQFHGQGKNMNKSDIERIFFHLVTTQVLQEYSVMNGRGFASNYVKVGPKARQLLNNNAKIRMQFVVSNGMASRSSPAPSNFENRPTSAEASRIINGANNNSVPFKSAKTHLRDFVYQGYNTTSSDTRQRTETRPIILEDNTNMLSTLEQAEITYSYHKLKDRASEIARELKFNSFLTVIPDCALRKAAVVLPSSVNEFAALPGLNVNQTKYYKYFKNIMIELNQRRRNKSKRGSSSQTGSVSPWFQNDEFQEDDGMRQQTEAILNQIRETQVALSQPGRLLKQTESNVSKRGNSTKGKRTRRKWFARNHRKA